MNTVEFSKAFAKQYNVAAASAETWVRSIVEFLAEQCVLNQEIRFAGFGTFKHNYNPPRAYADFQTGEIKQSRPKMDLIFCPGPKLTREMLEVPIPKNPPQRSRRKSDLPIRDKSHSDEAAESGSEE